MSKPVAIILLVLLAVLLIVVIRILYPSIKHYINRMPKGIFVLLFLAIIGAGAYLIHYLIYGATGGLAGNDGSQKEQEEVKEEETEIVRENCIVLRGSEIYVGNEKSDEEAMKKYIDVRVENNIPITLVDDYSTVALFRKVKTICDEKGVRYSIEDEKWLE